MIILEKTRTSIPTKLTIIASSSVFFLLLLIGLSTVTAPLIPKLILAPHALITLSFHSLTPILIALCMGIIFTNMFISNWNSLSTSSELLLYQQEIITTYTQLKTHHHPLNEQDHRNHLKTIIQNHIQQKIGLLLKQHNTNQKYYIEANKKVFIEKITHPSLWITQPQVTTMDDFIVKSMIDQSCLPLWFDILHQLHSKLTTTPIIIPTSPKININQWHLYIPQSMINEIDNYFNNHKLPQWANTEANKKHQSKALKLLQFGFAIVLSFGISILFSQLGYCGLQVLFPHYNASSFLDLYALMRLFTTLALTPILYQNIKSFFQNITKQPKINIARFVHYLAYLFGSIVLIFGSITLINLIPMHINLPHLLLAHSNHYWIKALVTLGDTQPVLPMLSLTICIILSFYNVIKVHKINEHTTTCAPTTHDWMFQLKKTGNLIMPTMIFLFNTSIITILSSTASPLAQIPFMCRFFFSGFFLANITPQIITKHEPQNSDALIKYATSSLEFPHPNLNRDYDNLTEYNLQ